MKIKLTKNIGSILDKYWAKIIYDDIGAVTQIQIYKLTGHPSRGDVEESSWCMDGNDAVDLIRAIEKELS